MHLGRAKTGEKWGGGEREGGGGEVASPTPPTTYFSQYLTVFVLFASVSRSEKERKRLLHRLFVEEIKTEPTAIKSWRKNCPEVADSWVNCIQNNYKITWDNKLRNFISSCCTEY